MSEAKKKLNDLPASDDPEFWEESEKHITNPIRVAICDTHTKENWQTGKYSANKDGTISCENCWWGTRLPGYYRLHEGKVVDLRSL